MVTKIVIRRIDSLRPFAKNSRLHSKRQIDQIAASIKEFGFTIPVATDDTGEILAGHGRVLAATKLGMIKVPTVDISYMTPAQRRAYVIADNKLAANATWNDALLAEELSELGLAGFDLNVMGFTDGELTGLGVGGLTGGDAPTDDVPSSWAIVVECTDEADQVALIERLEHEGRKVKGSIG